MSTVADTGVIDLRSDTVTRPTAGMREAIARAEVGDDALGDDPTVRRLEQRVADILDKPAALFFPSGIMANQTALIVLGTRGAEVICDATSHIVDWELGGAAANAGLQLRTVPTSDGFLTPDHVRAMIRPPLQHQIRTCMVALENTHNAAGGRVMAIDAMRAVADVARAQALRVHLDGARLWNASAASGVNEAEYAACADTVTVTMSKGLGCPIGSLLAGDEPTIGLARTVRRRLGGGMRQVGILAAAGLYALEHHRERLVDDHARAAALARLASNITGLHVVPPETNIVMFDIERSDIDATELLRRIAEQGVLMTFFTRKRIRAVTHLDVDDGAVQKAAAALAAALA